MTVAPLGRVTYGVSLPTCRHSQVLDCGEDSLRAKAAGSKTGALKRPKREVFQEDEMCSRCGKDTLKENQLLLCDGPGCTRSFHQRCVQPPLEQVPEGEWLCPHCVVAPGGPPPPA